MPTTKELDARIGHIITAMEAMQLNVQAHDAQIDALITISEENAQNWKNLGKQWQAYLNTLPRQ
ncbi:MAG: hypothetical protein ABI806_24540 [Candidatus Solibacter sp.]